MSRRRSAGHPFSVTYTAVPGALGIVAGVYGLFAGHAGAGVIGIVVGLSLLWTARRDYRGGAPL